MSIICDLCGKSDVAPLYRPQGTKRDAWVYICNYCGLLFTITADIPYSKEPNLSCDADWGNVRFCKCQRFDAIKDDLPTQFMRVLDVGSSRGHFANWYHEQNPEAEIVALEPDARINGCGADIDFRPQYIENANLSADYFDFVYCCQTLEHADSATRVLEEIYKAMKPGGVLFVEVPYTLEIIYYPNNTEEYFIDKHNFHFVYSTMKEYLQKTGFEILRSREDELNISLFAKKTGRITLPSRSLRDDIHAVQVYARNIQQNRKKIKPAVEKINKLLDTMKVAFWGANTMLDLMVKYGGLDPKRIGFLADDYMADCIDAIHGIPIRKVDELRVFEPDALVILARFSAESMKKRAQMFGIRNIIKFEDLM